MPSKKEKGVEITFIEVFLVHYFCPQNEEVFERFTVAVMDRNPTIRKHNTKKIRVACYRVKVPANSYFHKQAMSNSALGKIDSRSVALCHTQSKAYCAWILECLVKIEREIKYA